MRWGQVPVMMKMATLWRRARAKSNQRELLMGTCSMMTTTATTRTKNLVTSLLNGESVNALQAVKSENVSNQIN